MWRQFRHVNGTFTNCINISLFFKMPLPNNLVEKIFDYTDFATCIEGGQLELAKNKFDLEVKFVREIWARELVGKNKLNAFKQLVSVAKPIDWIYCAIENIELVKYLYYNNLSELLQEHVDVAAGQENIELLEFFYSNTSIKCSDSVITCAACQGSLPVVKFLHYNDKNQQFTKTMMDEAAEYGYLKIVEFLHFNRNEGCTKLAMDKAAKNGHIHVVLFLIQNRSEGCTKEAMNNAVKNGHIDIVKFLYYYQPKRNLCHAIFDAIKYHHNEITKFFFDNVENWPYSAFYAVASSKNLYAMNLLLKKKPKSGMKGLLRTVITQNNVWMFEILKSHLTDVKEIYGAVYYAAYHDHLDIIKYLYYNFRDCINPQTMKKASGKVKEFLRNNA